MLRVVIPSGVLLNVVILSVVHGECHYLVVSSVVMLSVIFSELTVILSECRSC